MREEKIIEESLLEFFGCDPGYYAIEQQIDAKRAIRIGYKKGSVQWKKVTEELPEDDREVLIYLRNLDVPHWSGNVLGAYIDNKWYFKGGAPQQNYEIVKWLDIPENEEIKTADEWNKIFKRNLTCEKPHLTERQYALECLIRSEK